MFYWVYRVDANGLLIPKKNAVRNLHLRSCRSRFGEGTFGNSKGNVSNYHAGGFQSHVSSDFAASVSPMQSPIDIVPDSIIQHLDSVFPREEAAKDFDRPSTGFASIEEAVNAIRDGKASFHDIAILN